LLANLDFNAIAYCLSSSVLLQSLSCLTTKSGWNALWPKLLPHKLLERFRLDASS
jgi:hypothetical protein